MRAQRAGERGIGKGCALTVVCSVIGVCMVAYLLGRMAATPELGAAPGGADDGSTPNAIAASLGTRIVGALLTSPHATAVVSERDLTVIARDRNPSPDRFHNPEARVRNSVVVVSAQSSMGPFNVTAIASVDLRLSTVNGDPHLASDVVDVKIGRQGIPPWVRSVVDPRGSGALSLDSLFNDSPQLAVLRRNVDCVTVAGDGVHIGVHRPGAAASAVSC